jgi:acyl carrier protein
MEKSEILKKVNNIFIDVLDNEDIKLTNETKASDIAEWDSLSNIQLVVAIEHEFGLRFSSEEIPSWKNVGDMVNSVFSKLN